MSHQQGREFRFLYLWLQAMLRRVFQRSLGLPAKEPSEMAQPALQLRRCPWN